MGVGVVGVETDQDPLVIFGDGLNVLDAGGVDGGALDHVDAVGQRVGLDGGAVVGADVDVEAEDAAARCFRVEQNALLGRFAVVKQGEHRGAEDQ